MIPEHPPFVQLETNLFFKFIWMQYLVQFYPIVFPLAFRYPFFALLHFQTVIRQYFLSQFFDRLVSTEIALYRPDSVRSIYRSSIQSNCFCLFVYSCCFPPYKICVRDTGIRETICLWNAKSRDLESVILLEESGILLMIGICTLTAMVMVFRSRWLSFWPYRLKVWPRLWRSNFWPVLLTDLLNARIFSRSKVCPPFVRCNTNEVCI